MQVGYILGVLSGDTESGMVVGLYPVGLSGFELVVVVSIWSWFLTITSLLKKLLMYNAIKNLYSFYTIWSFLITNFGADHKFLNSLYSNFIQTGSLPGTSKILKVRLLSVENFPLGLFKSKLVTWLGKSTV